MRYQQEFLSSVYIEIQALIQLHWEQIALNQDEIKLNPDWDQYEAAEAQGVLKVFTARDDGVLVGYFVVLAQRSMHYKDHIFAYNDVLFLHPDYRKGLAGMKLLKVAEKFLKQDGVSLLIVNTKVHKPFDALLERMGYTHIENNFSKRLN